MSNARENQQLGGFRLLRRIGSGGMGDMWLAEDTRLLRTVTVRIIANDAEARARLLRAATLSHPSIAAIHAVEEHDGCLFVATEFVEGTPLAAALQEHKLSDYDIVRIVRDIAEALAEAHAQGVVHGGVRADNVMIAGARVKVLDFGMSRQSDARTDLFALGVLLYHGLSGVPLRRDEPTPFFSVRPDLPQEIGNVIARCLQLRYATAQELVAALERVMPRLSRTALPVTPTIVLGAAEAAEPKIVASPYAGKRMLIADDDAAIRRLFETLARRQGIECDSVSNGPEAIAALKQREYALMFLDIMMPRIDGWGVLDYLRTRGCRVPTLFIITAFLDQSVSAADSEVVTGIIYKPVDADEIGALMRECVRGTMRTGMLLKTRHRLIAAAS